MNKDFNKGILLAGFGSFWWGFIGVLYFKYIAYIGHIELVVHRCLWTTFTLVISTFLFSKWDIFLNTLKNKKYLIYLFFSGLLIFINWAVWIYAIATDRIIDASFGYFMMPILSVLLGYIFFKEKLNKRRIFSILLVVLSILYLILVSFKSLPWVGIIVALSWGFYNLIRKKINIDTDIGLLIESLYILPFAALTFYFIVSNNHNDFQISDPPGIQMGPGSWEAARALIVRGVEINYEGVSGSLDFDINGDVEGMYSLNQVTEDNLWAVERLEKLHPFEPRIIID